MNDFIEVIKIGGPVTAISVVFLYYIDRMDKRTKSLVENHLQHVSDAINKNTIVLERLSSLLSQVLDKRTVRRWRKEKV